MNTPLSNTPPVDDSAPTKEWKDLFNNPAPPANSASPTEGFPTPDPEDGGLPNWFNQDVPDNVTSKDMLDPFKYPGHDVSTKLYRMIEWMQDNPSNKTAPQMFLLFLSKLDKPGGVFSKYPDLLNQVMSIKSNGDAGGLSIITEILQVQAQQNYFDGGNKDTYENFIKSLFPGNGKSGGDPLHDAVQDSFTMIDGSWAAFLKQYQGTDGKPIYTEDQFNIIASGAWGNFIASADIHHTASEGGWKSHMMKSMIDQLSKKEIFKSNPLLLLMLLIMLTSDASTSDEVGGYGATSNWLKKRTGDMSTITSQWGTKFASGDDAHAWMNKLEMLKFRVDYSPMAKGIKSQIDSQIGSILNTQAVNSTGQPMFMADGKTPITLQDLNDGYTDNTVSPPVVYPAGSAAVHKELQDSLNAFLPNPGAMVGVVDSKGAPVIGPDGKQEMQPAPVPPEYQKFMDNLKAASTSFSDQSQVVAQNISQLSSQAQQQESFLSKFLTDDIVGMEKVSVQHQTTT